jgi:N-acetylmuramoyl-L-alanine amidase
MRLLLILTVVLATCGCAGVQGFPPAGTHGSERASKTRAEPHPPRPHIVWRPIPFGPERRAQTAAYAARHYGIHTWRLRHPHVIVEHYTASQTFASAYATFASDAPDSELHELPGTCAHFVIDRDGTIYQLVPLDTICRHTVGLNWTAIGIEHVGTSDAEILHDRAQMRASLALTAWLAWRFHIQLRNVIGHSESLTSPYHHELVAAWRCQTHSDWQHADMVVYRRLLGARLRAYGVPLGPPARPVSSGC